MSGSDDRDLRERFAELRDEDAGSAPSFSGVRRGRATSTSPRRLRFAPVAALSIAAILTAGALVVVPRGPDRSIEAAIAQARSISSWTAPTDAWLTLSGFEIPDSVPSLTPSSVTLPEASTTTPPGDAP